MFDSQEAAFLQTIAQKHRDNDVRLVFADWLEERGESPRAEFIRVQCEQTMPGLAKERLQTLREYERKLLDAHRQQWCQAFELPVEDVGFSRGLIDKVRLSSWDKGKMLEPEYAPRFATLTELDLSELKLNDADIADFALKAHFPALRKLILGNNAITNVGATALAAAEGLPSLNTLHLFPNSNSEEIQSIFDRSTHFRLTTLDLGVRNEGYCLSPGEAEMVRCRYVRTHLLPTVKEYFTRHPHLQSAMLCVAQYYNDEAHDAVHGNLIVSDLLEPILKGVRAYVAEPGAVDPNLVHTQIKSEYSEHFSSAIGLWDAKFHWDSNHSSIPLWAAFAPEAGTQNDALDEVYHPAVMFYRHGGYEILPMCRPHLDGISPEWGEEDFIPF